jgi:hypothetical protein
LGNIFVYLERALRSLVVISEPSDEQLILDRLDQVSSEEAFESATLRCAIECLGSEKSIAAITGIAKKHLSSMNLINACQEAYEQICLRANLQPAKNIFAQGI